MQEPGLAAPRKPSPRSPSGTPSQLNSPVFGSLNGMNSRPDNYPVSMGNEAPHTPRQVLHKKSSVSDLLARLTTPTAASRGKMRDSHRVASSPHDLRPPPIGSARKTSNPMQIQISRPIVSHKLNTSASRSPQQPDRTQSRRRKAPSPPVNHSQQRSVSSNESSKDIPRPPPPNSLLITSQNASQPQPHPPHTAERSTSDSSKTKLVSSKSSSMSLRSGMERRQSAPAPPLNVTKPRAMSRANHNPSGSSAMSTTTSPSIMQLPKFTPSSVSMPGTPNTDTSIESFDSPNSSHVKFADSPSLLNDPDAVQKEMHRLKEHIENLKSRNRQLKLRADDAIATQDQTNVELSVCQASKNALEQQVHGYEALYEKTFKKLRHSQKLIRLLKYNTQELKTSLQEKDLENYKLTRKINTLKSALEAAERNQPSHDPISPSSMNETPVLDDHKNGGNKNFNDDDNDNCKV